LSEHEVAGTSAHAASNGEQAKGKALTKAPVVPAVKADGASANTAAGKGKAGELAVM
jgi:hypothetical protein